MNAMGLRLHRSFHNVSIYISVTVKKKYMREANHEALTFAASSNLKLGDSPRFCEPVGEATGGR